MSEPDPGDQEVQRQMRRMTRRSFAVGGAAALLGVGAWSWVRSRAEEDGLSWPLRRSLEWNEQLARKYFSEGRLAADFSDSGGEEPKVNGRKGLGKEFKPANWKLQAACPAVPQPKSVFTLDQIKALPRIEMVIDFKCIEGWSKIVRWGGVRLSDFAAMSRLATRSGQPPNPQDRPADLLPYVSLSTPDDGYYVGLDMASALHPQTLLCYEMNGQLLTLDHGGPLRLVTAVKYGYKSIKRIGAIEFTESRPADYWVERGYDWYAGH